MPVPKVRDPADPNRCQGITSAGQCWNLAISGYAHCKFHGGSTARAKANDVRMYNLDKAADQARLEELSGHGLLKSLHQEIAFVRMMAEQRWNEIKTPADKLAAIGPMNSLFLTLERLVKTAHQMEQSLGELLHKTTVVVIAQNIVQILNDELSQLENHETIVDRLTPRILSAVKEATNEHEEE